MIKIENKLHLCCCGGVGVGVQHSGTWGWYFLQQRHSTTAAQQPGTKWITVEWFSGSGQITASQLLQNSGGYLF